MKLRLPSEEELMLLTEDQYKINPFLAPYTDFALAQGTIPRKEIDKKLARYYITKEKSPLPYIFNKNVGTGLSYDSRASGVGIRPLLELDETDILESTNNLPSTLTFGFYPQDLVTLQEKCHLEELYLNGDLSYSYESYATSEDSNVLSFKINPTCRLNEHKYIRIETKSCTFHNGYYALSGEEVWFKMNPITFTHLGSTFYYLSKNILTSGISSNFISSFLPHLEQEIFLPYQLMKEKQKEATSKITSLEEDLQFMREKMNLARLQSPEIEGTLSPALKRIDEAKEKIGPIYQKVIK